MKTRNVLATLTLLAAPTAIVVASSGGANAAPPAAAPLAPLAAKLDVALKTPQTAAESAAASAFKLGPTARVVGKSATGAVVLVSRPEPGVTCLSIATDWAVTGCAYDKDVANGLLSVVRGGEASGLGTSDLEVVGVAPKATTSATASSAGKSVALSVSGDGTLFTGTIPAGSSSISLTTGEGAKTVPLR